MLTGLPVEGPDEYRRIVAFFCSGCMLVEFLFFFFCLSLSLSVWEKAVEGWKGERVKLGDTQRQVFFFFFLFSWSALLSYIRCHTLSLS